MKKRIKLKDIDICSFVTQTEVGARVMGGAFGTGTACPTFTHCASCPCSEAYTICCDGPAEA